MRTIKRDIVGPFIFSSDNKILLGYSGVYNGQLVVPGGGIEEGETALEALRRETLEETGIDINDADVHQLAEVGKGSSDKVLRETGERVMVEMQFFDFVVQLKHTAEAVELHLDSDYDNARWYSAEELRTESIGPATKIVLQRLRFLE